MSIITLPSGILFGRFDISQNRYDIREMSESGSVRERLLAPPRWGVQIASPAPAVDYAQAAIWRTMLLQLRGAINHLAVYDVAQPAPRGTMRGTLALTAGVSAGGNLISFSGGAGQAGTTYLKGDWLQIGSGIGSHWAQAVSDATANGSGVITNLQIEPPVRVAFSGGAPVTWDRPLGYFKMTTNGNSWSYNPGALLMTGFSAELIEAFN